MLCPRLLIENPMLELDFTLLEGELGKQTSVKPVASFALQGSRVEDAVQLATLCMERCTSLRSALIPRSTANGCDSSTMGHVLRVVSGLNAQLIRRVYGELRGTVYNVSILDEQLGP